MTMDRRNLLKGAALAAMPVSVAAEVLQPTQTVLVLPGPETVFAGRILEIVFNGKDWMLLGESDIFHARVLQSGTHKIGGET